jgi:predicted DNA-binding transcriptional regulator YafY
VLRVREGAALGVRRSARSSSSWPDRPGWDRLEVAYGRTDAFVEELLGYGPDVVVVEPAELRDAVTARLRAVVAGADGIPATAGAGLGRESAQEDAS